MTVPILIDYINLENLLEGYSKEPLVSKRYIESCASEDEKITKELLSKISARLSLDKRTEDHLEPIIAESVQNLSQHCGGESDVRLYLSEDRKKFLGFFELNEETQFGAARHEPYLKMLHSTLKGAITTEFEDTINDKLNSDDIDLVDIDSLATIIIMRHPSVKRLGVADIRGRAYFFFEYNLS